MRGKPEGVRESGRCEENPGGWRNPEDTQISKVWWQDLISDFENPVYSNFDNKNRSFFRIFNRSIGSVIYNLECMIAKSWSAFSKTPVFQFWIQFNLFAYFSLLYCIRHFEFRKSNRKILISDLGNLCIRFLSKT